MGQAWAENTKGNFIATLKSKDERVMSKPEAKAYLSWQSLITPQCF